MLFTQYVEVDESDSISSDELKSLLLNLNLNLTPLLLDDYREVHYSEMGAESSRSGDNLTWEQFRQLYALILRNQTSLFREIYNNKQVKDMDLQRHLADNEANLKSCFRLFDMDKSGYLDFNEFVSMLMDLSLHKQFARYPNPEQSFHSFCDQMWSYFDLDMDGKISFDEFVQAYN